MNLSSRALVLAIALASSVEAFSPSSYGTLSNQVSRFSPEQVNTPRYQPRSTSLFDADDEDMEDVDAPPPEDYLVNVGELEGDDDQETGIEDDGEPPEWYASKQRIDELRNQHKRHEKDTGSPEYQVAGLTERIAYLTRHLKAHPKDFSTRRGLVALVNKRRRLLNYLCKENETRYVALVGSLGIRHKAPGTFATREEEYGRFPGQKAVKRHLVKKR